MNNEERVEIKKIRFNSQDEKIELLTKETTDIMSPNLTEINIIKKRNTNSTIIEDKIQLRVESPRKKNKTEKADINFVRDSLRRDFNGILIKRGEKYKVTFADDAKKVNLKEIVYVENWKQYNVIEEPKEIKKIGCCAKCIII